ncbi:MAG: hypothetical protein ACRD2A_07140, partial [Vicinamibacterales bacterium]
CDVTGLTAEQHAVVQALVRDVAATIGVRNADQLITYLAAEGEHALELQFVNTLDGFRQKLVDDFQQRMHDEFVDVSWPRCPRHPNHPLWLANGIWRCAQDDVAVAQLGELATR